jgi:hypothetical protein
MNPLWWRAADQAAFLAICAIGAICGLVLAWVLWVWRAQFVVDAALFGMWLQRPDLYWPGPLIGAALAGLGFYVRQALRDSK